MASSRRRADRLLTSVATRPASPTATTKADTASNTRSTTPTTRHNSSSVTPGRIASSGSPSAVLISRCTRNTVDRRSSPISAAVTRLGLRSNLATNWAGISTPGMRLPPCQSRWMASIAARPTSTERSTGVPVRASTPVTVKGLSACSAAANSPAPWLSTIFAPGA